MVPACSPCTNTRSAHAPRLCAAPPCASGTHPTTPAARSKPGASPGTAAALAPEYSATAGTFTGRVFVHAQLEDSLLVRAETGAA